VRTAVLKLRGSGVNRGRCCPVEGTGFSKLVAGWLARNVFAGSLLSNEFCDDVDVSIMLNRPVYKSSAVPTSKLSATAVFSYVSRWYCS